MIQQEEDVGTGTNAADADADGADEAQKTQIKQTTQAHEQQTSHRRHG